VEPLPQTRQVLTALAAVGGGDLEETLLGVADRVSTLIPSCVGLSLSVVEADLTLTFVATSAQAQALDGVQGAHGGPCVDSPRSGEMLTVVDVLDESRWQEYAQAAAAEGVRSSLSLPLLDASGAVGAALNVYAAEPHAFDGVLEDLRSAVGPLTGRVTTNADLPFSTRDRAADAPRRMAEESTVATAVGCLVAQRGIGPDEARDLLTARARQGEVTVVQAAQAVLDAVADGQRG
jgi:GAF domain-containing protein